MTCANVNGTSAPVSATVVVSSGPVPVVTITANPTSGAVNVVSPSLTWSATNSPTSCVASGDWSGAKAVSGTNVSQGVLTTVKTYTYSLACSNSNGSGSPSSATVVVTSGGATATLSLGAANCIIGLGASTCTVPFTWNITGATTPDLFNATRSIEYSNQATCGLFCPVSYPITFGMNTVQARDGATVLASVFPTGICTSGTSWNGSICAAANPSATLTASPTNVSPNGKSTLTWTSANATSCTASGGSTGWPAAVTGANYTGGSWLSAALPAGTYTYTLTCSKSGSPSAVVAATVASGVAVCGDGICQASETPLSCPTDCKTKIIEF